MKNEPEKEFFNRENRHQVSADAAEHHKEDSEKIKLLVENIEKVFKGKRESVELAVASLLSRGHILIEDVPGMGKTTLAMAIAASIGCVFKRIQFTSDLLPTDIVGVSIFNQRAGRFEFQPGPIFANVVLADEINRTTPRTQSALLEAMNEFQVTVDNTTHKLNQPFMVIATQNPREHHGTYPLPESQMDRFFMRINPGYPERTVEEEIIINHGFFRDIENLPAVLSSGDIVMMQSRIQSVYVDEKIRKYLMDIVHATRNSQFFDTGISTRGAICLYTAAKAIAYLHSRAYCLPDDVKELVIPVFCHRVAVKSRTSSALPSRDEAIAVLSDILDSIPSP